MTEDMIHRAILFVVIGVLSFWGYKWLGMASDLLPPVELDPDNPRDRHEARCIDEQMKTGRERNGYRWKDET